MKRWIAALLMAASAAASDVPELDKLEGALSGEPNSVRAGSEYRQAVIRIAGSKLDLYDRCIKFFEQLVAAHPKASNAYLNYGFAYVDKIPAAGAITQVILANTALSQFTKSIELEPSWIGLYTRGNSYLYWPKIFNRAHLGVADLERAVALQKDGKVRSYYIRAYIGLGDGYWKTDQIEKAKAIWGEGLKHFPTSPLLKARLSKDGDALKEYIDDQLDPNRRVDTNLRELWESQ